MGSLTTKFELLIFILIRISSIFVISPIFGRRNLPNIFKIGFSLMVTLLLINVVNLPNPVNLVSMYDFTAAAIKELLVGLILGYISFLVFSAIYLAGQIIDTQMGFGMVNVLDPIANIQIPITANLYYTLAMIIFLSMNGHHMLIEALVKSYDVVPIGTAVFSNSMIPQMVSMMGYIFIIALKISAPVIAAILIVDIALGILSRTMPQMNIFVVGMPLKIFIGLIVVMITIPTFLMILGFIIDSMSVNITTFMNQMK